MLAQQLGSSLFDFRKVRAIQSNNELRYTQRRILLHCLFIHRVAIRAHNQFNLVQRSAGLLHLAIK